MSSWENTKIQIRLLNIEINRQVDAPAWIVWDILTDTFIWPYWGPSVTGVDHCGRHIGAGSKGRVKTIFGKWAPFEIIEFENGRYWSWKVFGIQATGHRIEDLGDDRCNLVFEIPLLSGPYTVVCSIAANRIATIAEKRVRSGIHS